MHSETILQFTDLWNSDLQTSDSNYNYDKKISKKKIQGGGLFERGAYFFKKVGGGGLFEEGLTRGGAK